MTGLTRRTLLNTGTALLATPFITRIAWADAKQVNVYNWADYIGETTIADFEAATGIKTVYDNYDSAEGAEAKLMAGSSGYDVVVTASRNIPRFLPAGILHKLDKSKLPNISHLDPSVLAIVAKLDPGNEHTIPYMWGTTGVTYNTKLIEKRLPKPNYASFDMFFKPEFSGKLSDCGLNMIDSPATVVPMVLAYLGKDPLSEDPKDLDAVVEAFAKVRKAIRSFDNSQYTTQLVSQDLCMTTNWAGDYAVAKNRARESNIDISLRYDVPETGGTMWLDTFIIPSDAANVDAAHVFLNYMMEPEVIAKATNYVSYANANRDANAFVDKAILDNPAVYPDEDVKKRIWLPKAVSPEYESARTRAWTRIMTGS
ncbi:MAG: polyamine transporter substrate-binding protein [Rhizobium sp.]|nr:polyamine transporter substrate-binding protein [Rhizobium sp.]